MNYEDLAYAGLLASCWLLCVATCKFVSMMLTVALYVEL
jgi:hypothetical protein